MIILPLDRRIDWRNPPFVTVLLALVNILVFVGLQSGDHRALSEAVDAYLLSDLPQLELAELRRVRKAQDLEPAAVTPMDVIALQYDKEFRRRLAAGEVIAQGHPEWARWSLERGEFERRLGRSTVHAAGFTPAEPRLATWFSHMFLHGGALHLIGNTVFLVLVGFVIEYTVGPWRYIALYLAGGLAAAGIFQVFHADAYTPLVGASGAISALMGAYAVFFGLRRIWFFYSVGIYFDYVRAPAIWLLPVWVLYELLQHWYLGRHSPVAYMAHAGGLSGGALIAGAMHQLGRGPDPDYLDAADRAEHLQAVRAEVREALAALDFNRARRAIGPGLRAFPNDAQLQLLAFRAEMDRPGHEAYHQRALTVLQSEAGDRAHELAVARVWRDYRARARPKPRMSRPVACRLSARLQAAGCLAESGTLLEDLLNSGLREPWLADRLVSQYTLHLQAGDGLAARRWLGRLKLYFPTARQTAEAVRMGC